MRTHELVCVVLTAALAAGCGKDDAGEAGKAGGTTAGAGGASGTAAAGAAGTAAGTATATAAATGQAEAPLPGADRAAVQQVVDAWLAAQNAGDLAAYQALYADKMEGVKRVGARTWRFDRKGWLEDRGRMFKHKMTVGARDVTIDGSAAAPVVELTQTFQQGRFADEGHKRLVLQKTPAGLRIAREEMVRSVVGGALAGKAGGQLWLPLALDGKTYAVLDAEASDAWADGALRGPFSAAFDYALRTAGKAPSKASWATRELAVYDAAGKKCSARIGALELVGGGTPHFGEKQRWEGFEGEPPLSKGQQARAVFDMSPLKLLGELVVDGGCTPVVIVDAASTAKVLGRAPDDDARHQAAAAAFRKLPAYQTLQRDFEDSYGGTGAWAELPTVRTFTDGTRTIVVASAREGDGCGDFYGALTAIFEETGGKLKALSAADQAHVEVAAVLDVDGDGKLELIGDPEDYSTVTALYEHGAGGFVPTKTVDFPFNDCSC